MKNSFRKLFLQIFMSQICHATKKPKNLRIESEQKTNLQRLQMIITFIMFRRSKQLYIILIALEFWRNEISLNDT